jgi:MFS family permease
VTVFYRRGELARRLAIFYAASNIASAFGGLLSFGVFQIHSGSLANWRYLFVIEGGLSMLFSLFAFWILPYNAQSARFLTEEEKQLAFYRVQVDSSSVVNEKFNLRSALAIFKHPTSWVILAIEMCLGVPLQSVSLFLPVIVKQLGYSTVKSNLYTVAPNITGAVMLLILAFASDYTRLRFPFVALGFAFTCIGFIIFAAVSLDTQIHTAYFACFMMTWGTSAPSVILDVWYNNNIADENKRVMLTSVGVPVANLMGVVSSNIFQDKDAPKYLPALITTATFGATGCVLTLLLGAWMVMDNKRRNTRAIRAGGKKVRAKDVPTELLRDGPAATEYRWFY